MKKQNVPVVFLWKTTIFRWFSYGFPTCHPQKQSTDPHPFQTRRGPTSWRLWCTLHCLGKKISQHGYHHHFEKGLNDIWLVVYLPHWKIWKSIGMIVPNRWEYKKCSKPPTRICFVSKKKDIDHHIGVYPRVRATPPCWIHGISPLDCNKGNMGYACGL